jgi:predicted enzyme related to lactoylglutathione lyase
VYYPVPQVYDGKLEPNKGRDCQTDDIRKTYAELKAKGVDIDEPKELGFGIFTQFRDVDGNEFGLREDK